MKELPILFSTEMVQALLTGKKTMTRRTKGLEYINNQINDYEYIGKTKDFFNFENLKKPSFLGIPAKCQIGDLLWVRETFAPAIDDYAYKADYSDNVLNEKRNIGLWKPSLFMPKAAARIWLKVTNVKVERLQSISAEDSIKEGIKQIWGLGYKHYTAKKHFSKKELEEGCPFLTSQILSFLTLWESINGKESLELNPWVFVYEFEVVSTKGKP